MCLIHRREDKKISIEIRRKGHCKILEPSFTNLHLISISVIFSIIFKFRIQLNLLLNIKQFLKTSDLSQPVIALPIAHYLREYDERQHDDDHLP